MIPELKNKRVISVAINGAWTTREHNPNLPLTPKEVAQSVYESWQAGAAIAHIHARDAVGKATDDLRVYEEIISRIRDYKDCDICINISSSGGITFVDDERILPIETLKPELASYDCGTMNWQHRSVFPNSPAFLERLGKVMLEHDIKPEIEVFGPSMLYNALHYIKTGVLKAPCHFQFVLGVGGGVPGDTLTLAQLHALLPEGSTWSACGIGQYHIPVLFATIAMGGHLRVGMEDNVYFRKGMLAESNAQFVARAKHLLGEAGLEAATPQEARQIYGLRGA